MELKYFGKWDNEKQKLQNRITQLFEIKLPIIQAGMVWVSGYKLAAAVSNAGGLGIIGAGSMYPSILEEHLQKCKKVTSQPFAVNLPLLYPDIEKHIDLIIKYQVPIVFTSAGNPKIWTKTLKANGIKVVHVVSSSVFALKSQDAGVDAVVAEGFEAGGHNGREETTTMCLLPLVRKVLDIPLIAAGGIANGNTLLATMLLGAEAAQIGTRFVCTHEASSHLNFKEKITTLKEGDTELILKQLVPVRLVKNNLYTQLKNAELKGESPAVINEILGKGKAKLGMLEGDIEEGELEIGQVSAGIDDILPAATVVENIWKEFITSLQTIFDCK